MATAQLGTLLRHIHTLAAGRSLHERTDQDLLDKFHCQGDEAAFAALVGRHGAMVLRVCRRVLRHEQDAEDAFQATFLVLARKARSIRKRDTIGSWLHGVAYRSAMNAKRIAARRRHREARVPIKQAAESPTWDDVQSVLDEEILRLPRRLREAFVLCVLESKSGAEAAAALQRKEGTIKSRLSRARCLLQQRLERRGIQLTALLAALSVTENAGRAALPVALARTAARYGGAVASKGTACVIPTHIVALAAGVARAMFLDKVRIATMLVIIMGLCGTSASLFTHDVPAQPPKAQRAAAQSEIKSPAATPAGIEHKQSKKLELSGRVLDPAGNPARAAKLFVPFPKRNQGAAEDLIMKHAGVADAEGRFKLTFHRPDQGRIYLVAQAPGFGADWVELNPAEPLRDITLRLVNDVPISGRVINTEGRPIAGVSVSTIAIAVPPDEKLDDYLEGWLRRFRDNLSAPRKVLHAALEDMMAATTDKDGRFVLRGAGGERIVQVTFAGGGIARSTPWIITRAGFDAKPYNAVLSKPEHEDLRTYNRFLGLYPPALTFVAEPGKTVEGIVKDAASGKPLAGCYVSAGTGWGDATVVVSDADGKYRLDGLTKIGDGIRLFARMPKGSAYLNRRARAAGALGKSTERVDIEMVAGAIVSGRVIDRQTGKGVYCGVRFAPLADNKFFASKPGFDNYRRERTTEATDKDGRFRLVTIPGKALVMAQVHEGEKLDGEHLCVYREAVPDPDHMDLFKPQDNSWMVTTAGGSVEFLSVENAVKVIDIKENGATQVDLFVDRGRTTQIELRDAEGQPLAGAWAAGLTDHWPITYKLPATTATVYALNPEKPRTMAFFHGDKKIGGTAVVRGDEKEPVIVKLAPLGQVSGRLLDVDGNALDGVDISVNPIRDIGSELYRFAAGLNTPVRTDKDGSFRLTGVLPGLKFYLSLRRERTYFVGVPRIGARQVKPGETLKLGDVRAKGTE
jgi:RNA polymerase sigma factor (sigma-70 family)